MADEALVETLTRDEGASLFHEDLRDVYLDGDTSNIVENRKRLLGNSWYHIPRPLLVSIFQYLSAPDLIKAGLSCSAWYQASKDDLLWRDLLKRDFAVNTSGGIMPGNFFLFFCVC